MRLNLNPALQQLRVLDGAVLWLLLACLLVAQSLLLSLLAADPSQAVSLCLAWYGALLVCRAPLPMASRDMRPSLPGASLGTLLLLWVQWRVHLIAGNDPSIYLLPLVSLLGLLFLALPVKAMRPFLSPVLILALLPGLQIFDFSSAAINLLRHINAGILRGALFLLGFPVRGDGLVLTLYDGGVEIWGSCSGLESVRQLLMIAIIFAIAFPMLRAWQNVLMCWTAICLAVMVNVVRIGLLLFLDGGALADRQYWFESFHTGWPSLLFPGLATYLFVSIYVLWMERQVAELEDS